MQRLALVDRWLLAILVPTCLAVYGLHVWSVVHRDLANAAIYAAPPRGDDPYPTVGGLYPESRVPGLDFEVGDRLLRVEGQDLRGVGYARFDGILLEAASKKEWVEIDLERNGTSRTSRLRAIPYPMPWHRFPMLVSLFGVGTLIMLRGRDRRQARIAFVGFLSLSIVLAQFRGGPAWMTELGLYIRWLGLPVAFAFAIATMMTIPDPEGRPTRMGLVLCATSALFSLLMRAGYHLEFPLPASIAPRGALLSDVFFMVSALAAPRWRLFPRSVLAACVLAMAPMATGSIIPIFVPESTLVAPFHAVGYFALALIPVVFLSRIVTEGLFDVDRILSAAATYTVLVTLAIGALLGLVPSLAMGVAAVTGLSPGLSQWVTALGLALVLVPLTPWLRTRVERFFFPERHAFAEGIEALRVRLDVCRDDDEVMTVLGAELSRLLRVDRGSAYLRRGSVFYRCFSSTPARTEGERASASIDAKVPAETLRGITSAILLDGTPRTPFDLSQRTELAELGVRVVLPIHRGSDMVGFLCLGEKRSGAAFSDLELSRLTATADRASARLEVVRSEQLAHEVEAADKEILSRSRFMANASHDLRQPLQALSLFAGALSKNQDGEQVEELARNISRSTDALREMFEGLLDLSRIEAGRLAPDRGAVALAPLFERLESELSPVAAEKGIELHVVPTSVAVESDPALLGRILQNLLVNAIRYTQEGAVLLGVRRRGAMAHIEVLDTGPGIPKAFQRQIFEEFERMSGSRSISDEGLGLGLAIVSRLAEELGHQVELSSEVGKGSRFSVIAGRCREASEASAVGSVTNVLGGFGGAAVLVVDDERSVREATRALLESWGCRVETAATPGEVSAAIARLEGRLDVVIADYRLAAGETGVDAVREARRRVDREIPAVFITGNTPGPSESETQGAPVLTKPLAPARLRSVLHHFLRSG